ncbi:MAG TPA: hypothetical protein VKK79_14490 [Candidatus Lokiarchaeia archaeon]|nr:hypothetical protein [Candidatus Lokiarchaeia archaeon]
MFRAIASDCAELHAKFARGAGIWKDFQDAKLKYVGVQFKL